MKILYIIDCIENISNLLQTLESLNGSGVAAILARESSLDIIQNVMTQHPPSLPVYCLGLGEGVVQSGAAYNAAIRECKEWDAFVVLKCGDILEKDYGAIACLRLSQDKLIGGVVTDYSEGGIRIFEEPYSRNRLIIKFWEPRLLIPMHAAQTVGLFDEQTTCGAIYEFILRLTSQFIISHIPYVLISINYVPQNPEAEHSAWDWAINKN